MHLTVSTRVLGTPEQVMAGFNRDLFLKLNPPFPKVRLLRFDGSKKGDLVSLELNFILFKQEWTSEITEDGASLSEVFFVDVGKTLPFFLTSWVHRHIVKAEGVDKSRIIDDVRFTTGTLLTDLLIFPALWLQFIYRKPIYKKHFSKRKATQ